MLDGMKNGVEKGSHSTTALAEAWLESQWTVELRVPSRLRGQ